MATLPDLSQAWTLKEAIYAFRREEDREAQETWVKQLNLEAKAAEDYAWELNRVHLKTVAPDPEFKAKFEAVVKRTRWLDLLLSPGICLTTEPALRGLLEALRKKQLIAYARLNSLQSEFDLVTSDFWSRELLINTHANSARLAEAPYTKINSIKIIKATPAIAPATKKVVRGVKNNILRILKEELFPPDGLSYGSLTIPEIVGMVDDKLSSRRTGDRRTSVIRALAILRKEASGGSL